MSDEPSIAKALAIEDKLKRSLYVVGLITRELPQSARPIVVGGTAVEFYTLGAYTTQDVDLVCPVRRRAIEALERLGFERSASRRHWYHAGLQVVVEIPDERLAGDDRRVAEVTVDGLPAYVIGVEDLILDRLRACVHWRSESDCEWARRLLMIHMSDIDWEYLSRAAEAENLKQRLDTLLPEERGV